MSLERNDLRLMSQFSLETCNFSLNRSQKDIFEYTVKVGKLGMRLQAIDYWKCSKIKLHSEGSDFKFVIVEPLNGSAPNQVSRFLEGNHGPGLQHIAFYTENIMQSINNAVKNGLNFNLPPQGYYEQLVLRHGQSNIPVDLEKLKRSGALLDFESCKTDSQKFNYNNYLLQIFTKPVFDANTLFFELIYRHGSTGFGEGNIDALWRSVEKCLGNNFDDEFNQHDTHQ
ncbi:hypothetical protein Ciccas_001284 [Cichlidogyrus casuarinus]|uniref:VOC domain-containing protein n=1 Tax=Cichlidogyrus casuarinus TaxID=1844966 RepID=A0ABD2QKS3_9PLAT